MKKHRIIVTLFTALLLIYTDRCGCLSCLGPTSLPFIRSSRITTAPDGSVYLLGRFHGKASFGATTLYSRAPNDLFLTKMNAKGTHQWAVKVGGSSTDFGDDIVVTKKQGLHLLMTSRTGLYSYRGFWLRFGKKGARRFRRALPGRHPNTLKSIGFTQRGDGYILGTYVKQIALGATLLKGSHSFNSFIAKVGENGQILWGKKIGYSQEILCSGLVFGAKGDIFISGVFQEQAKVGHLLLKSPTTFGSFVARLRPNGEVVWAKQLGGTSHEYPTAQIAIDSQDRLYATGEFQGKATLGKKTLTSRGKTDIFVAQMTPKGDLLWARQIGSESADAYPDIKVDSQDRLYLTGKLGASAHVGVHTIRITGKQGYFVARLDASGSYSWSQRIGDANVSVSSDICVDKKDNLYIAGAYERSTKIGTFQLRTARFENYFVAKFNTKGKVLWVKH